MKTSLAVKIPVLCATLLAAICILHSSYCRAQTAPQTDILVRIARIEQVLNIIDESFTTESEMSGPSPSAKIRGMMMGTEWIDSDRAVVIGLSFGKEQMKKMPDMAALVPFNKPNKDFASAYGAEKKNDHYLVPLQQGKAASVAPALASALSEASEKPPNRFVSVDIAASRLISKAEQQIQQLTKALEQKAAPAGQKSPDTVSAGQADMMMDAFLKLGRQIETLSLGLDLNQANATFSTGIKALGDSEIAGLMAATKDSPAGRLGNISPSADLQTKFRCRPHDTADAASFLTDYFGGFYNSMGFDIGRASQISSYFTGEIVGAISISYPEMQLETIAALNPENKPPGNFLESEYIPWMVDAGKKMAESYQTQDSDLELDSIITKTGTTTIEGNTVAGVEARLPISDPRSNEISILRLPVRMTVVNNCLLAASDDIRIKSLIQKISDFEPADSGGPLFALNADLSSIIKASANMNPQINPQMTASLPETAELVYTVRSQGRTIKAEYSMKLEDIRRFVESMQTIKQQAESSSKSFSRGTVGKARLASANQPAPDTSSSGATVKQQNKKTDQPASEKDLYYWMDKGGLYASYGNQDAAIKSYKKALELDPHNAKASFNLGLAYAENGEYDKALGLINRAVSREPENGNYLYGLGWVHMLAGRQGKATKYIKQAAQLRNPDALKYLNSIAPRKKGRQPE